MQYSKQMKLWYNNPMNDDQSNDEKDLSQTTPDGEELIIKDPIYDIMSDDELEVASDRLTQLIEDTENDEKQV